MGSSLDGLALKLLTRIMRHFDRLQTITLSICDYTIGAKGLIEAFGAFRAEQLLSLDGLDTLPTLIEALAASGIKITNFSIGAPSDSGCVVNRYVLIGSPQSPDSSFQDIECYLKNMEVKLTPSKRKLILFVDVTDIGLLPISRFECRIYFELPLSTSSESFHKSVLQFQ